MTDETLRQVREGLERDGFAVVHGVLSPAEVADVSDAFDRLLARARTLPETTLVRSRPDTDEGGTLFVLDADPFRLHRVVWAGGVEPALARYGGDPRFLALARAALGVDTFDQLVQQAHYKLPHDGVSFAWHQDASNRRYATDLWTDVDGRGSYVQIGLAVDAMGPDNGGLAFVRGSHRQGFVADPLTGTLPGPPPHRSLVVAPELAAGDVCLFGPFTVHGSEPNSSDRSRRLFLQGYAIPGANARNYPGCGLGVRRSLREVP
ncbi:MAG: phytanoyl-CoA dioxygenase family protein [Alphaproteobacteria bacterium]|nr:phytanoyl-CoA dioxygenase family protein [Alphaproteobacteria bacterium]